MIKVGDETDETAVFYLFHQTPRKGIAGRGDLADSQIGARQLRRNEGFWKTPEGSVLRTHACDSVSTRTFRSGMFGISRLLFTAAALAASDRGHVHFEAEQRTDALHAPSDNLQWIKWVADTSDVRAVPPDLDVALPQSTTGAGGRVPPAESAHARRSVHPAVPRSGGTEGGHEISESSAIPGRLRRRVGHSSFLALEHAPAAAGNCRGCSCTPRDRDTPELGEGSLAVGSPAGVHDQRGRGSCAAVADEAVASEIAPRLGGVGLQNTSLEPFADTAARDRESTVDRGVAAVNAERVLRSGGTAPGSFRGALPPVPAEAQLQRPASDPVLSLSPSNPGLRRQGDELEKETLAGLRQAAQSIDEARSVERVLAAAVLHRGLRARR